ncbi:PfkB family carbohydrate kinase [Acuticoccus sp. MNP-M23]|uniref:carbohydrate kinase family protein n=1 Tax=Acuticoccus sp. MNP-M23 TaxID=3072793 RepID=UPI00281570B9|nr:PfkB family carbohydrate kinase [Acuticoccus sp. MNP-M23]WMS43567.1 PfkB family carbohydrate kinase [Acuticoccus sp. MNP-M23]
MGAAVTIVSAGEILAEFIAVDAAGVPIDASGQDPQLYAGPFPSGAPAIAADQAARCGAPTQMFGAVGDDLFGRAIVSRLKEGGTDVSGIEIAQDAPTGTAHVAYHGDGSRAFVFHIEGSAAERCLVPAVPAGAILMVSGSTLGIPALRAAVLDAAVRVRKAGGRIAVDPNVRAELMREPGAASALNALLAGADFATPSEEDLAALMPGASVAEAAASLRESGIDTVAVTCGAGGVRVFHPGGELALDGHAVDVVDPTGAGDAFAATFVATRAAGASVAEAARFANAAGALAVTRLGPMEGNSSLGKIRAFLGDGG